MPAAATVDGSAAATVDSSATTTTVAAPAATGSPKTRPTPMKTFFVSIKTLTFAGTRTVTLS